MTKRTPKQKPVDEFTELDAKVNQADPIIKQAFSEYKKEISRLQKQLVKDQIAHESEIERMKAQFKEQMESISKIDVHFVSSNDKESL